MDFLAQIVQFWQVFQSKVRSSLPSACLDALNLKRPDEPGGGEGGEHEMSQYTTDPNTMNGQPVQAVWDEATGQFIAVPAAPAPEIDPEFGSETKLTEWQAGWNVTNAIQVSSRTPIMGTTNFFSGHVHCQPPLRCTPWWLLGSICTRICCLHLLLHG